MSSSNKRSRRQKSDEELWSRKFGESREESNKEATSRASRHASDKESGMSPLLTGVVILFALLALAPITYVIWADKQSAGTTKKADETMIDQKKDKDKEKEKKKKEKAEKEKAEKEAAKKKAEEEKKKAEAEKEAEAEAQAEKERQRQEEEAAESSQAAETPPQESSETSEQSSGGGTHVVQPGETLYRIATNNGMSVDQLMAINGLSSTELSVGQVLQLE